MATTFAMPTVHGHGGHAHSHSRNFAFQTVPLQPTSMNGGSQTTSEPAKSSPLKPQDHRLPKSADISYNTQQHEQHPAHLELPQPHPSFSTPTSARSKSMERRKSVGLPTHLRLQGNGYGFPASSNRKSPGRDNTEGDRRWSTARAIVSAVLIPLPCVLASMAFSIGSIPAINVTKQMPLSVVKSILDDTPNNDRGQSFSHVSDWTLTFAFTSMTLLLVGLRGKLNEITGTLDRRKRKSSLAPVDALKMRAWSHAARRARRVAGRVLTVGLPFYATSKLGGARVALVILVALASNIMNDENESTEYTSLQSWSRLAANRPCTIASILVQLVCDFSGITSRVTISTVLLGYMALGLAIFVFPPPLPSSRPKTSIVTSSAPTSESSTSTALATPWEAPLSLENQRPSMIYLSPMISTSEDVDLTIWSGVAFAVLSSLLFILRWSAGATSQPSFVWCILASCTAALALTDSEPGSLRYHGNFGFVLGSLTSCLLLTRLHHDPWRSFIYQSILAVICLAAMKIDTRLASSLPSSSAHHHHHHQRTKSHPVSSVQLSRFSAFVLDKARPWPLLHSIIAEKDSRRIFYFMCLNFAFMLVQTFYGIATGSLGLLSDSIHMFFDCLALVVGLCAAVMSKWPPSTRFPYGYGKMDTLAGFANGIFLMLISVEIVYEALERLAQGNRIQRLGELLTVSVLGFIVNIVGLTAFGHAHHGHSHGHEGQDHSSHSHESHGHSHDHAHHDHCHENDSHHDHLHHDHSHHDHPHHNYSPPKSDPPLPSPFSLNPPQSALSLAPHLHDHLAAGPMPSPSVYSSVPTTPSKPLTRDSHTHAPGAHGHHHHGNENMHGIFLHVLADTLGSVAVVISTLLIHYFGWSGFDPLASCVIAILIFGSAIPLVTSSARTLLLTVPGETEYDLREALSGLSTLRGVVGYAVPKFWLEEGDERRVLGVIHITAAKGIDLEDLKEQCVTYLKGRRMEVLIQVEREGDGRCWCTTTK